MNPYKILKVAADATPEEIKDAYRRESRRWHPDRNPGKDTSKKFNEVHAAYRLLSDPTRRERYDRTGEADEGKPDNSASEILAALSAVYTETIMEACNTGKDLKRVNLVAVMKGKIGEKLKPIRKELSDMEQVEAAFKESSGRFEGDAEGNPLLAVANSHLKNIREQREIRLRVIATYEEAQKLLSAYRYRTDKDASASSLLATLNEAATRSTRSSGPYFIIE